MPDGAWQIPVVNGERTFLDLNGLPLASGQVFHYVPGTTTPSDTWQDADLTVVNTNPIILDAAGRARIWGRGTYRQIVTDRFGNLLWDQVTGLPPAIGDGQFTTLTASQAVTLENTLSVGGEASFKAEVNVADVLRANGGIIAEAQLGLDTAIMSNGDVVINADLTGLTVNSALMDTTADPDVPMYNTTADGRILTITGPHDTNSNNPSFGNYPGIILVNTPDAINGPPGWGYWAGTNPNAAVPVVQATPAPGTSPDLLPTDITPAIAKPSLIWGVADTSTNNLAGDPLMMLSVEADLTLTSGISPGLVLHNSVDNVINSANRPADWKMEASSGILHWGLSVQNTLTDDLMYLDASGNLTIRGSLNQQGGGGTGNFTVSGNGIIYSAFGSHAIGFNWTGTGLDIMVDGSRVGSVTMGA